MKDLKYQSSGMNITNDNNNVTRFPLDASFQDVNRLFVLAFDNTENGNKNFERDSYRKCFLPRVLVISPITMYKLMAETFMINQLMIKSKSMMKLEKLQQEKVMITELVV